MSDVLPFKIPKPSKKHRGNTLCKRSFHKWEIVNKPFDVKQGKLVTLSRCVRCGVEKSEAR